MKFPTPERFPRSTGTTYSSGLEYTAALLRHFADLRDGTHGGASSRRDKERLFAAAVPLLDPHGGRALEAINTYLLLGTGEVTATGVHRSADGGIDAAWALSWPEQRAAGLEPIVISRLLRARIRPPASAGWHCRRLATQRARRGAGDDGATHPACDSGCGYPQPCLPTRGRRSHHSGHCQWTQRVSERVAR